MQFLPSIHLPWDHVKSHSKFGPDRFSRFDVYRLQTNRQARVYIFLFVHWVWEKKRGKWGKGKRKKGWGKEGRGKGKMGRGKQKMGKREEKKGRESKMEKR